MKNIILKISLAFVVFFVGNFKIVYSNEMKSNNINTRVISEFYNYVEEKIEDDGNEKIRFANTSTLIYPTWSCTGDKYEKLDNIFTLRNSKVDAIHYLKPLTVSQLNSIEVFMNKYPNVIELSEPTKNYNCHSYAFYSQDVNNNIAWISNPTIYYSDYSYDEITNYTEIKKGDIICYFDKNNVNKHSAIVERIDGIIMNNTVEYMSNLVVSSKWGEFGLYQHKGDYCPYVKESNANFKNFRCFRPHQHKFIYNQILEDSHFGLCSICGDPTTNGEHHFEFNFEKEIWKCNECQKEKNPDREMQMDCRINPQTYSYGIAVGGKRYFEIHIACETLYELSSSSPYILNFKLYKSNGILIENGDFVKINGIYDYYIIKQLPI